MAGAKYFHVNWHRAAMRPSMPSSRPRTMRDHEDGIALGDDSYTVKQAVEDWLQFGLSLRGEETRAANESLCRNHVIPLLGARRLRDLTAREVDAWLLGLSTQLSTRTFRGVRACLVRAVSR